LFSVDKAQFQQRNGFMFDPTWTSLARDYLPVPASSVSCERVFSSAGLTITKRRNRLKADVVEAIQCLKFAYKKKAWFKEVHASLNYEEELEAAELREEKLQAELDVKEAADNDVVWGWELDDDCYEDVL
jgi:hypothetical protein